MEAKDDGRDDAQGTSKEGTPQASPRDKKTKLTSSSESQPTNRKPLSPRDILVAASPPKFVNLEDIMKMANGVTDMSLAHEIAVDNDFRLEPTRLPANSIEERVKEVVHKAFWDVLEEQLREVPPDYSQALVLLQEVKSILYELLLPHQTRLRQNIDDILDMQLIEQKAVNGVLDFESYAAFIINLMATMCAPVRDEQIAQLKNISNIVQLYREIFKVLDLMKMDMMNFTITQMRPYIQQHSVKYEQDKFQALLTTQKENGIDGLEFTRVWLARNVKQLKDLHGEQKSNDETSAAQSSVHTTSAVQSGVAEASKFTTTVVLNAAYLEILDSLDEFHIFPETLLMDHQRFVDLGERIHWLTLVVSVLIVTYSSVGPAITGIADFKQKLKQQVQILTANVQPSKLPEMITNVGEQVIREVSQCLSEHGFPQLKPEQQDSLKGQIAAVIEPNNPIYKLMKGRLFTFLNAVLTNPKSRDIQLPAGFTAVSDELSTICAQLLRLTSYNQAVFTSYYSDIITMLVTNAT